MNDFLKNLRQREKQQAERNNRRPYNNPQYRGNDKGNGKKVVAPKLENVERLAGLMSDSLPELMVVMTRMAEAGERRAEAETRKADAIERVATNLESLLRMTEAVESRLNADTARKAVEIPPLPPAVRPPKADRDKVLAVIETMRSEGATYGQIADHLESEHIPTFSGKGKWHAQTIHRICQEMK